MVVVEANQAFFPGSHVAFALNQFWLFHETAEASLLGNPKQMDEDIWEACFPPTRTRNKMSLRDTYIAGRGSITGLKRLFSIPPPSFITSLSSKNF